VLQVLLPPPLPPTATATPLAPVSPALLLPVRLDGRLRLPLFTHTRGEGVCLQRRLAVLLFLLPAKVASAAAPRAAPAVPTGAAIAAADHPAAARPAVAADAAAVAARAALPTAAVASAPVPER